MPHPVIAFLAPGGGELIVVMLALLLLFGPKDAPRILRNLQSILNKLKRTASDFQRTLMSSAEMHDDPTDKSKDTSLYDAAKKPAEEKAPPPPVPPPTAGSPP